MASVDRHDAKLESLSIPRRHAVRPTMACRITWPFVSAFAPAMAVFIIAICPGFPPMVPSGQYPPSMMVRYAQNHYRSVVSIPSPGQWVLQGHDRRIPHSSSFCKLGHQTIETVNPSSTSLFATSGVCPSGCNVLGSPMTSSLTKGLEAPARPSCAVMTASSAVWHPPWKKMNAFTVDKISAATWCI